MHLSVGYALLDGNVHKVWKATKPALGFIQCQKYDASQFPYKAYILLVFLITALFNRYLCCR